MSIYGHQIFLFRIPEALDRLSSCSASNRCREPGRVLRIIIKSRLLKKDIVLAKDLILSRILIIDFTVFSKHLY